MDFAVCHGDIPDPGIVALDKIQLPNLAGTCIRRSVYFHHFYHDATMKTNHGLYHIVKQIHLYSSLLTVALLLMYIITSYMMIYHDWFKVENKNESLSSIQIAAEEINDENWNSFLKKHQIKGRLTREDFNDSGDLIRTYSRADGNSKVTIFKDKNEVEIKNTELNLSGSIIGLHRMRGYGGSLIYNFYAFMRTI